MNSQTLPPAPKCPGAAGAVGSLLRDLIDYAGLFPPASLAMAQTAVNYDSYLRSEENWILGRFIVPVARARRVRRGAGGLGNRSPVWRLSALLGPDIAADVICIREFNQSTYGPGYHRVG